STGLHAIGHLERVNPRRDFWIADLLEAQPVQLAQSVEGVALQATVDATRARQVQHRIAAGAELHALVDRRQKATAPVGVAAAGALAAGAEDDEARQVLRLAAQAIQGP